MQFDDRLSTLLAFEPRTDSARAALWAQLIDLLAQGASPADGAALNAKVAELSASVLPERRQATALAVGARTRSAYLVRIFASDSPRIAAPVMLGARLTTVEWQDLIPRLPPTARALLRQRRDLPREAEHALRGFGHSDFAIPAAPQPATDNTQIRDLMARIADWRAQRTVTLLPSATEPVEPPLFRFEADAAGTVTWTDATARAAVIGLTLANGNGRRDIGFDGHATGAFAKRAPFRHARLTLAGPRIWSIAGDPVFRTSDGRFLGYRCLARPIPAIAVDTANTDHDGDAFRQLAHELRTPLNAVHGFSAMIEAQLLGPVGEPYRARADSIGKDAGRLLTAIDDAEGWSRSTEPLGQTADLAAIVAGVSDRCAPVERDRGAVLHFRVAADLPTLAIAAAGATRLIAALARIVLAAAANGEQLRAEVGGNGQARIAFTKPAALVGLSEAELFADGPDDDEAVPLGLGFTLRMIATRARSAGGGLDLGGDALVLRLPVARDSAAGASESI